jgi:hypothetical protein
VITGTQIRLGRAILGWDRVKLCKQSRVSLAGILRAEAVDGTPPITVAHSTALQLAFEEAGLEFDEHEDEGWSVRRRTKTLG